MKGDYGDNSIDWAGLSYRVVRGWFRDTQCLSQCDEGHTYGRWCLLGKREDSLVTYRNWKKNRERR